MAVGVLIEIPGGTQKQYKQVTEKMFGHYPMRSNEAPAGLLVHSSGPNDDGWYVYDLWKTREDFDRFAKERIRPAVREVMGRDAADPQPQFFEVASLIQSR